MWLASTSLAIVGVAVPRRMTAAVSALLATATTRTAAAARALIVVQSAGRRMADVVAD